MNDRLSSAILQLVIDEENFHNRIFALQISSDLAGSEDIRIKIATLSG